MKLLLKYSAVLLAVVMTFAFASCEKNDIGSVQDTYTYDLKDGANDTPPCYNHKAVDPTVLCCEPYKPVCACEYFTFDNACEAEKSGFVSYEDGPCTNAVCPSQEVRELFYYTTLYCPVEFYVCGCDGKTYTSYCRAIGAGNTSWRPGKCGGAGPTLYELKKHM